MLQGHRIAVVMPAYNAEETLLSTYKDLPLDIVDDIILTDDASRDATVALAQTLERVQVLRHANNRGYGANQKTCYRTALSTGADIVVMVHPDYQYSPRLVTAMASMIASGHYDVVLGSRILGGKARQGGMPLYKYVANRSLTLIENVLCGAKLSEYHSGFRAFSRTVLQRIAFERNSDGFVFDNEILVQALYFGFRVGELSCPTRYFAEASSIQLKKSVLYGLGVLECATRYRLQKLGLRSRMFDLGSAAR